MKRLWHLYTTEYDSAVKKSEKRPFAAPRMDPETVTLSEVRQTGKDKDHMASLVSGIENK